MSDTISWSRVALAWPSLVKDVTGARVKHGFSHASEDNGYSGFCVVVFANNSVGQYRQC